jgi:hypothetical protein
MAELVDLPLPILPQYLFQDESTTTAPEVAVGEAV